MTSQASTAPANGQPAAAKLGLKPARQDEGSALARWMSFAGLLLVCLGFSTPVLWCVSTSLMTADQTHKFPTEFIPNPIHPQNYADVINHPKFNVFLAARNTLVIAVLTVLGTVFSSAVVAYGFARIRFKGRGFLFGIMLATMMIPFPVVMVSLFSMYRWFGDYTGIQMLGTFRPLWVPAFFGSAFNIFLLRQFFITIPDEISDAARIDGCSEIGIFLRIILPLARPALAVVALFAFMGAWNDFLGPLIYVQHPADYTLALSLYTFQNQHTGTEMNMLMAASMIIIAPVIILFFLVQRTFIEGIATTGMKG